MGLRVALRSKEILISSLKEEALRQDLPRTQGFLLTGYLLV